MAMPVERAAMQREIFSRDKVRSQLLKIFFERCRVKAKRLTKQLLRALKKVLFKHDGSGGLLPGAGRFWI